MKLPAKKQMVVIAVVVVAAVVAYLVWQNVRNTGFGPGFASGNGRIEATEINISTKLAGRIDSIEVDEGDFVHEGDKLVVMQTNTLYAQLGEAKAQLQQAISNKVAAQAAVAQRESELSAAQKRFARSSTLHTQGAMPVQTFDDDQATLRSAQAAVAAAKAQVNVVQATIEAAQASIARIQADIDDSTLIAPTGGRIQYRISQPGEVLGAGGKVLNLVDLSDVYLTFFLSEKEAGQVALNDEVRLVLDAFGDVVVPAHVSYVASVAQFTPKTVETQNEREKYMFRVKAQIDPGLLACYTEQIKTGVPGVAWVKLDPKSEWPAELSNLLPLCDKAALATGVENAGQAQESGNSQTQALTVAEQPAEPLPATSVRAPAH